MMGISGFIIVSLNALIIGWDLFHTGSYLDYCANSAIAAGFPGLLGKLVIGIGPSVAGACFMTADLLDKEKRHRL